MVAADLIQTSRMVRPGLPGCRGEPEPGEEGSPSIGTWIPSCMGSELRWLSEYGWVKGTAYQSIEAMMQKRS